jgi:N-acetylmuramoyl-L-alanine amidase
MVVLVGPLLAHCAGPRLVDVRSANQDGRIRFLVLHFTDENFERSLDLLTQPHDNPVSAHYLVSRAGDAGRATPTVFRLVDESQRAWHAGPSRWQGHEPLNGESIGIEIVYESGCPRDRGAASPWDVDAVCPYPAWPKDQVDAVVALCRDILRRHPEIVPSRVVGHSDVQPDNKTDPGPRFPWQELAAAGVGAWFDAADVDRYERALARADASADVLPLPVVQEALAAWGYGVAASGEYDQATREALFAFQSHFLPDRRTGRADRRSVATLLALLGKYRGEELERLRARHGDVLPPAPRADAGR